MGSALAHPTRLLVYWIVLFRFRELGQHGCMSVEGPPIPTEERRPAWRRACSAYDAWRTAGASHQEVLDAAVAAVQTVLSLPWSDATVEAEHAVAYAVCYQPKWFWEGARQAVKWRAKLRDNLSRRAPRH